MRSTVNQSVIQQSIIVLTAADVQGLQNKKKTVEEGVLGHVHVSHASSHLIVTVTTVVDRMEIILIFL